MLFGMSVVFLNFKKEKMNLLFVCLGNICRSPAAEGVMLQLLEDKGLATNFVIDSAGTYAGHRGELPDMRMRNAARKRGLILTHRSRPFVEEDFERFDMILVMDDMNYESVVRVCPDRVFKNKICRMTDFCTKFKVDYVPDPYYSGHEGFEYVLDILEDACLGLLNFIQSKK